MAALTADQQAMVEANMGLVLYTIRRRFRWQTDEELSDMIQDGSVGLIRAVTDYDPARARISTYASWWIYQAVGKGIRDRLGSGYRRSIYQGTDWEDPLSIDWDGDDDRSLTDVLEAPGSTEGDALDSVLWARVSDVLEGAATDDVDREIARGLVVAAVDGAAPEAAASIGGRLGVSPWKVNQRRRALVARAEPELRGEVA
jgi:RNA polymerase sigma factor (sigma-70 family)